MKTNSILQASLRISLLLMMCTFTALDSAAQFNENDADKTLSPYFFVMSNNPEADQLPLKSTSAQVEIAGVIANVKVTQVYKNEGRNALEAIYIFPASTRAAVYDMKMTIGERTIQAVIKEREQARQEYEKAKEEGKSASLLEQQRPNVFQMNVANILPGDLIKVELSYSELLVPEKGVYEFVYPTVVGPRYSNQPAHEANNNDKWVSNPYTTEGNKPLYTFDMHVNLNAGMPLKDINCSSHLTDINYNNASNAVISLKNGNDHEGNRDFILRYRLQGEQIQTGVLLYPGKTENYFLAMVQPPQRILTSEIPPREYVFIMDVSGSMNGFPIDISKKLMHKLLGNLRPTDRFNVILFAGVSNLLNETSIPVNETNIQKAINMIDKQQGSGGTELIPALDRALKLKGVEGYARTFVIATDGYVNVEKQTFDLIRNNLGNASFFAFGIGTAVNRYIIEGMAHVGNGEPFIVEQPAKAEAMAERFREYIQTPVLTNVKVSFEGFNAYDAEPLNVPTMYADRPLLIYGKYKGAATGKIIINGNTGSGKFHKQLDLSAVQPQKENKPLQFLWARNRIMILDDYSKVPGSDESIKKEVTALGLKYNLLTAYTSFIAIDSEVRNNTGKNITIKQPLPLPEGVNNNAVGYAATSYNSSPKMKAVKGTPSLYTISPEQASSPEQALVEKESEVNDLLIEEYKAEEEPATFLGGDITKFAKWAETNLQLPENHPSVNGKIVVQFTVDESGKITDVKILKGMDSQVNTEVIKVMKNSPSWKPALKDGNLVRQVYTITLHIKK